MEKYECTSEVTMGGAESLAAETMVRYLDGIDSPWRFTLPALRALGKR